MFQSAMETSDHIFAACGLSKSIWGLIGRCCDVDTRNWSSTMELFQWIDSVQVMAGKRVVLDVICSVGLWSIWRIRNEPVFGNKIPKKKKIGFLRM